MTYTSGTSSTTKPFPIGSTTLTPYPLTSPMTDLVHIELEDAQAIAQNIQENLQYDGEDDQEFWQAILTRLNTAIRHSTPN